MAKNNPINLVKLDRNKKKAYLTHDYIEKNLKEQGLSSEDIKDLGDKAYVSQYIFGNKEAKDIFDISKKLEIFSSKTHNQEVTKFKEIPDIDAKMSQFTSLTNNIAGHLKKSQTAGELQDNALEISYNYSRNPVKMSTSVSNIIDSYKKFQQVDNYNYWDTEGFSGVNEHGIQELIHMQEISVLNFKKVNGDIVENGRIETLLGFDLETQRGKQNVAKIQKMIDEYEATGKVPNNSLAEVTLSRLALIGNKNSKVDFTPDGLAVTKRLAGGDEIADRFNIDDIKAGLQLHIDMGNHQRTVGRVGGDVLGEENSIPAYMDTFFGAINSLNNNFTMGKNIRAYDDKSIATTAEAYYKELNQKQIGYLKSKYGDGFNKLSYNSGVIDQEDVARLSYDLFGTSKYYSNEQLKKIYDKGFRPGQLEGIGHAYYEDVYEQLGGAHASTTDVFVGGSFASRDLGDGKSLMDIMMDDIMAKNPDKGVTISNNVIKTPSGEALTPVFVATNADGFGSNPFDFSIDSVTGDVHFANQKVLDKDGNVRNSFFAPNVKKNTSYTLETFQLDANNEAIQAMKDVSDYYKGDNPYYVVKATPILDKSIAKGNEDLISPIYRIFRTEDEISAYASNNFIYGFNMDEKGALRELSTKDGVTQEAIDQATNMLSRITVQDGAISVKTSSPEEIVRKGTIDIMNDSAARSVRDYDINKVNKFLQVQDKMKEAGYSDPKKARDRIAELTSADIANKVAKGKPLTMEEQNLKDSIVSIVGYKDRATNKTTLHPGTYKNFLNTYEYYGSMGDTLSTISELSKGKNKETTAMKFNAYMNGLRYDIADKITGDDGVRNSFVQYMNGIGEGKTAEQIVNGISQVESFKFDTNFFEFNLPDFFSSAAKDSLDDNGILRVDIGARKQYSLVSSLLNKQYGTDAVKRMSNVTREESGKREVVRLMRHINGTDDYSGEFDNILKEFANDKGSIDLSKINVSADNMSERFIHRLRELREDNPGRGMIKDKDQLLAISDDTLIGFAKQFDENFIQKSLENTSSTILAGKEYSVINAFDNNDINAVANKIVDNVSMNFRVDGKKISNVEEIANFAAKTYGHDAKSVKAQVQKIREEQLRIVTSIIEPVMTVKDSKVIMSEAGRLGLQFGSDNIMDITDYMPISSFNNGILRNKIAGSNLSGGLMLNVKDAISNGELDTNKVKVSSNLAKGSRELRGLKYNINKANTSPQEQVLYSLKSMDKALRENPQVSIGNTHTEAINSIYNMDMSELQLAIPHLDKAIEASDAFSNRDKKIIKNNIKRLAKKDSDAEFPQIFADIMQPAAKLAMGISPNKELNKDITDQYLISGLNSYVKSTSQEKFIYHTGGRDLTAFQQLSNYKKPPIHQKKNAKLYSKEKLEQSIIEQQSVDASFLHMAATNKLVTSSEQKIVERTIDGVGKTTNSITAVRANIDDKQFHGLIKNYYNELKNNDPSKLTPEMEEAFKVASSVNIFEQQKVINNRVGELLFEGADTQFINAKKDMVNTVNQMRNDMNINKKMFETQTKVLPHVKLLDDGKVLFEYGDQTYVQAGATLFEKEGFADTLSTIGAKHNGLFSFGYYGKDTNLKVDQKSINDLLSNSGIKSPEEAIALLNDQFTARFAVESITDKGHNKMYIDSEKGMATFAAAGAGRIDKRIKNVLDATGHSDKYNTYLKDSFIDTELANVPGIQDALEQAGFDNIGSLKSALRDERNYVQDKIISQLPGMRDVAVSTNDARVKHESVDMAIKDFLGTAAYKSVTDQETDGIMDYGEAYKNAYRNVYDVIKDSDAFKEYVDTFDEETGQIIFKNVDASQKVLKLSDIKDVGAKLGVYDEENGFGVKVRDREGNVLYTKDLSVMTVAGPSEFAGISSSKGRLKQIDADIKKARIDPDTNSELIEQLQQERRTLLGQQRLLTVDERTMESISRPSLANKGKMESLNQSMGNIRLDDGDTMFNRLFGDITENVDGETVLKEGVDTRSNAGIIADLEQKARYNKELSYMGGGYKELTADYVDGLSEFDERRAIYQKYKEGGFGEGPISIQKAELAHARVQGEAALSWNAGKLSDEETMISKGFDYIKASEMNVPKGSGSADYIGLKNVPFQKSFMLDLEDGTKVAVPYMPAAQVGNELVNTEINKSLGSISRITNDIEQTRLGKMDGNLDNLIKSRAEAVDSLRTNIKSATQGVTKELKTAQLDSYSYNKASAMLHYLDDSDGKALASFDVGNASFFSKAEFMGKKLGDLADEGVYVTGVAASENTFRDAGYFDSSYLSKMNMTEDQMREHLSTKGTVGIVGRNPQTEKRSTSAAMIYLDENKNNGQIGITAEGLLAMNGDIDGDNLFVSLTGKNLDDQQLNKYMTAIGADTNQNKRIRDNVIEKKILKERKESLADLGDIFENDRGRESFINMIDHDVSVRQASQFQEMNKTMMDAAINDLGKETFESLKEDEISKTLTPYAESLYKDNIDTAKQAINYGIASTKQQMANISNSSRADIGYMDTPMTELERMASAMGYQGDSQDAIGAISKAMKESPISKKHASSTEVSVTNRYRAAWGSAMRGSEKSANEVLDIVSMYKDEILEQGRGFTEILLPEDDDEAFNSIISPLHNILESAQANPVTRNIYLANAKINEGNAHMQDIQSASTPFGRIFGEMTGKQIVTPEELAEKAVKPIDLDVSGYQKRALADGALDAAASVLGEGHGAGGMIAKAALGLAAAVMVTGYIGGNPSAPADNQAEQMQDYESLQDQDLSIQQLPQGTGQGYVVNINARSEKGQQHAMQAIQKAMHSSVTTDINIAMNIKDRTSNINSSYIDKLLTEAL